MVVLRVSAAELADIRFATSPMSETVAALQLLAGRRRSAELLPLREYARSAYERVCRRDPTVPALAKLLATTSWLPDFICPPPAGIGTTFADEVAAVANTSDERAHRDFAMSAAGRSLDERFTGSEVASRVAESLTQCWQEIVAPIWPRLSALAERDVVYRAGLLATYGWSRAMQGLNLGVRWRSTGRIEIGGVGGPDHKLDGARLTLVPCTLGGKWLALDPPHAYALIYPARGAGTLWTADGHSDPRGIDRLIGGTRAIILRALHHPATTTQLARQLGLSIGGVADHLAVLYEAGAVTRARNGRNVLYWRTWFGNAITDPNHQPPELQPTRPRG